MQPKRNGCVVPRRFLSSTRLMMRILGIIASPERRREMKQYAGFVLFEPENTGERKATSNHYAKQCHPADADRRG